MASASGKSCTLKILDLTVSVHESDLLSHTFNKVYLNSNVVTLQLFASILSSVNVIKFEQMKQFFLKRKY